MRTLVSELITAQELEALEGLKEWLQLDKLPTAQDLSEWMWRGDW